MASMQERAAAGPPLSAPGLWQERLNDPFNRFYRHPLARLLVKILLRTPITPNQVSFVQPFLAVLAGYFVTFPDRWHLVSGALVFELRTVLACAGGAHARARRQASAGGHAVDIVADWLATALLYAGIFWHVRLYPPPSGAWSRYLSVGGVLLLALAQGALWSLAADHYKLKYTSIFERGCDATVDELCRKVRAIGPGSSIFARVDLLIARAEHLAFDHERSLPLHDAGSVAPPAADRLAILRAREGAPIARLIALLWSVSNGDAFLSLVTFSLLTGRIWEGQLFFAVAGLPWLVLVVALNARFARGCTPDVTARGQAPVP
jgi:phosphatidylglycerophosphate synthase